ncbi:MAG: hypothetical protein AB4426_27945 [Xenococcaceae cyanobacterium]
MKWEDEFAKEFAKNVMGGSRFSLPGMTVLLLGTIGTLLLAPIIVPAVKKVGKSIAKTTVKGGIIVYEGSKELVSEAKAELAAAQPEG